MCGVDLSAVHFLAFLAGFFSFAEAFELLAGDLADAELLAGDLAAAGVVTFAALPCPRSFAALPLFTFCHFASSSSTVIVLLLTSMRETASAFSRIR